LPFKFNLQRYTTGELSLLDYPAGLTHVDLLTG
jgi:hypothetical protein